MQVINHGKQITAEDLRNDLAYIDDFLMELHNGDFSITGEEVQLINHDLNQIKKHIKRMSDADYNIKTSLAKKVVYLQKVTNTQKRKADLEKPKKSTEIKSLQKKMPTVIIKRVREQAAPVLTKKEGKKEDKTAELKKEFGMFFPPSSSSSHQPVEQPNARKSENASPNTKTKNTHLFIENLTNKTLIVRYTPINGQVVRTQEIAPGQKSSPIDRSNIQNLFYHCRGASSTNAIDRNMIQRSRTIQVKSKKSPFSFFTGDSFTVEQKREPARD